jgi:hypothetical protein
MGGVGEMTQHNCKNCHKDFYGQTNQKFCSVKCYSLWQSKNVRGSNHPNWKGKELRICKHCKKEFYIFPYIAKKSKDNYCSLQCYHSGREYPRGEAHRNWQGGKIITFCKLCGKRKEKTRRQVKVWGTGFCSQECWHKWCVINEDGLVRKGERNFRWQGGISNSPYPATWTQKLKKQVRERDDYTCQICGKVQKKKRFAVHHIDYCKKNNKPENLITLCGVCHPMTNGNRKFWKKWFRGKQRNEWQTLFAVQGETSDENIQREVSCSVN